MSQTQNNSLKLLTQTFAITKRHDNKQKTKIQIDGTFEQPTRRDRKFKRFSYSTQFLDLASTRTTNEEKQFER